MMLWIQLACIAALFLVLALTALTAWQASRSSNRTTDILWKRSERARVFQSQLEDRLEEIEDLLDSVQAALNGSDAGFSDNEPTIDMGN